ncbi:MAG: hypothetical protein CVU41_17515 [Chloroflexi bacterium HGW-Chloroflexi-3]|nr:MAG: hypothetical protein CVU41_17515 [Chloroflexi bacterium HGW-Chloroflexi-3]
MIEWVLKIYPILGWTGSLVILLSSFLAALAYRGKQGERYKISTHFVSELGEVGVSRLAWLFNGGLITGSFIFLLMMPGVGLSLDNILGYLGSVVGMIAAVGCLFVGVYPMNNFKPHIKAAMTYFRAGLATVLLFSIAILAQPADSRVIPFYSLIIGGMAFAAYFSFLIHLGKSTRQKDSSVLDTSSITNRPRFWWMAFLEWMVVIFTILWFLIISAAR